MIDLTFIYCLRTKWEGNWSTFVRNVSSGKGTSQQTDSIVGEGL